ncbi:hypothetical protein BACINT_00669 [Bacteroides intestinalis DSM 17393]|uniref:Uncharacterized protein n=1 Tax=Bacteroides intestinalis DSM 17393 TaxID=471870 RepID=B3C6Y0_9BACE|nr:hypothetical protein BACINT_00669 [Bacteroides intestinalis DSM 17393]
MQQAHSRHRLIKRFFMILKIYIFQMQRKAYLINKFDENALIST